MLPRCRPRSGAAANDYGALCSRRAAAATRVRSHCRSFVGLSLARTLVRSGRFVAPDVAELETSVRRHGALRARGNGAAASDSKYLNSATFHGAGEEAADVRKKKCFGLEEPNQIFSFKCLQGSKTATALHFICTKFISHVHIQIVLDIRASTYKGQHKNIGHLLDNIGSCALA